MAGEIKGTAHSYVGQEAVAAGVCANLTEAGFIASHHRGHGHCIAKGAEHGPDDGRADGRETGYCRGLGGSMHIADLDLRILGANGIVGASMPLACGAALAAKLRGEEQRRRRLLRRRRLEPGRVHESLNLAAVWRLPVVFVCENNQYALTTLVPEHDLGGTHRGSRGVVRYPRPCGVDGNDISEIYHVAREAIAGARAGEGPTLIEALTYRVGPALDAREPQGPAPRRTSSATGWRAIRSSGSQAGSRAPATERAIGSG